jgi:type IV pilus assembly protein PilB
MTDSRPVDAAKLPTPLAGARVRVSLGAILVREGHITVERLEEALAGERAGGRRLGEILIDLGWVTPNAVAQALAEQHGLDYVDLAREEVDPEAATLLPEAFARRYQALPLRFVGPDLVLVAVGDPGDAVASDGLRLALGLNVRVAVAATSDLEEAIARAHREQVEIAAFEFAPLEDEEPIGDDTETTSTAPVVKLVNSLLARAVGEGASDVHFEPQERALVVRIRVDGVLRELVSLPKQMQAPLTTRLKVIAGLDIAERRLPQDGRLAVKIASEPVDLRVAVLPTTFGEQVVLRILRRAAVGLGLSSLGMSDDTERAFVRAVRQPYGAVVVCGPTGSGKTTTLYAALQLLNSADRALMTIEDPVEQHIPGVVQVEVAPRGPLTFPLGLRTILRSDPDVLMVGEIRDEETAGIAVQAAMTGHLVLTTLHTHSASSAIVRLRDMGVESPLLASALNCIVAQRLARRLCPDCLTAYEPSLEERAAVGVEPDRECVLHRADGCVRCAGTGFRGRVALYEVMPIRGELRRLFAASTEEIFAAARAQGMTSLHEAGMRLCREGVSSVEEIRRVIGDA